jgi:hypothetical protein
MLRSLRSAPVLKWQWQTGPLKENTILHEEITGVVTFSSQYSRTTSSRDFKVQLLHGESHRRIKQETSALNENDECGPFAKVIFGEEEVLLRH